MSVNIIVFLNFGSAISTFGSLYLQASSPHGSVLQAAHKLSVLAIGVVTPPKPVVEGQKAVTLVANREDRPRSAMDDSDPATAAEAKKLKLNCCNNLAACHFQVGARIWNMWLNILLGSVDHSVKKVFLILKH